MSNKAKEQLLAGVQCDSLKFDFRLSAVRVPFITWVHSALKKIIASKQNALSDGWVKSGISVCWPVSPEAVDERDALYDNARALQREGKLFVMKGGKSKDSVVDGVLTQTVLNPARARKASRSQDNDVYDDDESDASQHSAEDVNDPMYDDMLRELEVVEEEEEVDRDEEGEDDTHLPDQLAECFHINTYTTRGGRQTKVPVKYT